MSEGNLFDKNDYIPLGEPVRNSSTKESKPSFLIRVDDFMWPNKPVSRYTKSDQHVTGSFVSRSGLLAWRIIANIIMWGLFILSNYEDFKKGDKFFQLQYMTCWGLFMTTITFTCLLLGHCTYKMQTDSTNLFCWWKTNSFLFQTSCVWNTFIALLFWTMLWPSYTPPATFDVHEFLEIADHSVPITLTVIDWILNGIRLELNAFWAQSFFIGLYGLVNISFTKITGNPVYPPVITWDSPISWVIGSCCLPLGMLLFFFTWYVTLVKTKYIYKNQTQQFADYSADDTENNNESIMNYSDKLPKDQA